MGEPKGVVAGYVTERRFQNRQKDMLNSYHYSLKKWVELFFAITKLNPLAEFQVNGLTS